MFAYRNFQQSPVAELERIECVVRARFGIPEDQIVLITEDPTRLQGGPKVATTILFFGEPDVRHKVRIFKPATEVTEFDLPASWLRGALIDDGEADCC